MTIGAGTDMSSSPVITRSRSMRRPSFTILSSNHPASASFFRSIFKFARHTVRDRNEGLPVWTAVTSTGRALLRAVRRAISWLRDHSGSRARPGFEVRTRVPAAGEGDRARPPGRFTEGRFGNATGRTYMLYEPAFRKPGPAPMLVLLHGCHQDAKDFAVGTRMNEAAEEAGMVVLYPEQSRLANALRCWNWYTSRYRSANEGEAALIVAMTRRVMLDHDIDPARIYIAGMSAGGAMAALLARDHPGLYAALGVHSGVPAALAHDVFSAMRLMFRGPADGAAGADLPAGGAGHSVPSIVFHGDEDMTVHPSNGQAIHSAPSGDQAGGLTNGSLEATTYPGAGQHGVTRSVDYDQGGVTKRELWIVHGAGHAWAGGSDEGSHTDADGPDASREMLRFFLQHRQAGWV